MDFIIFQNCVCLWDMIHAQIPQAIELIKILLNFQQVGGTHVVSLKFTCIGLMFSKYMIYKHGTDSIEFPI